MTCEDDFQRMLDERPDDHTTRLVFADWLQERGDPRTEGYRALGALRRHPHTTILGLKWVWLSGCPGWEDHDNAIPECWHALFARAKPSAWKYFPTRREAEDAAAHWRTFAEETKAELEEMWVAPQGPVLVISPRE